MARPLCLNRCRNATAWRTIDPAARKLGHSGTCRPDAPFTRLHVSNYQFGERDGASGASPDDRVCSPSERYQCRRTHAQSRRRGRIRRTVRRGDHSGAAAKNWAGACSRSIHTPSGSMVPPSAKSRLSSTAACCTRASKADGNARGVVPQIAAWFGFAASYLVPCELVTAPIAIDRLHEVDRILSSPAGAGRKGDAGRRVLCVRAAFQSRRSRGRTRRQRQPS